MKDGRMSLLFLGCIFLGLIAYHVTMKTLPKNVSAPLLLAQTYAVAALTMLVAYLVIGQGFERPAAHPGLTLLRGLGLAVALCAIEIGYIFAYRSGLKLSTGNVVVLGSTTTALAVLGNFLFAERLSLLEWIGVGMVIAGLYLILAH